MLWNAQQQDDLKSLQLTGHEGKPLTLAQHTRNLRASAKSLLFDKLRSSVGKSAKAAILLAPLLPRCLLPRNARQRDYRMVMPKLKVPRRNTPTRIPLERTEHLGPLTRWICEQ